MLTIKRHNTILYCNRWSETVAFYRDQIGLSIETELDWFVEFRLSETAFLSVANAARASIASADGAGITLAWHVPNTAKARAALVLKGIACTPLRKRWGSVVCYCHDPEGNRIELWQ